MKLSIGIVGLPNVGKSTLFNALTKKSVPAENYPFCTIDPAVGVVGVPDERLQKLTELSRSQKTIPAAVEFVDIAGLVEGASTGEGLGNQFLSHIREVDAILHMVRIFEVEDETGTKQHHVYGDIDPLRDIEVITMELVLADLDTVKNRMDKNKSKLRTNDKIVAAEQALLERLVTHLESEKPAYLIDLNDAEKEIMQGLHLITMKSTLYSFNKKSGGKNLDEINPDAFKKVTDYVEAQGNRYVKVDAATEHDLKDFDPAEKQAFKDELGEHADDVDALIREAYSLLGLISYFTTGEAETRAWQILKDSTAPEAGAAIHTDFQDKFIRAEVVHYDDLLAAGGKAGAREAGKLRLEGKEYIVQDGDVIEFKV
jgi:hypothetical protein